MFYSPDKKVGMGLKIGSSEYFSFLATFMGANGVYVLQAGPSSKLKNSRGGWVLLGQAKDCVGSAGSCLQPRATEQGGTGPGMLRSPLLFLGAGL